MLIFAIVGHHTVADSCLSHRRDARLQRRPATQSGQIGHRRVNKLTTHVIPSGIYGWSVSKTKRAARELLFFLGTEGRDRTGTSVTSSVFETDASTDSATSAWFDKLTMYGLSRQTRLQKYGFFHSWQSLIEKNLFLVGSL